MEKEEIKIEKGIPIPPAPSRKVHKYPFDQMDVGDSFAFPSLTLKTAYAIARYENVRQRKDNGSAKIFLVRRMDDSSLRCWRIE